MTSPRLKAWKWLLTLYLLPSLRKLALHLPPPSLHFRPTSCHAPTPPFQPGSLTSDPPWPPCLQAAPVQPATLPLGGGSGPFCRDFQTVLTMPGPQPQLLPSTSHRCWIPDPREDFPSSWPWLPICSLLKLSYGPFRDTSSAPISVHSTAFESSLSCGRLSYFPSTTSVLRAELWLIHLCPPTGLWTLT